MSTTKTFPAVQAAAQRVATAEAHVERTSAPLEAANATCDRLQTRLGELDRQRADLLARRQAGEQHQDDAANLSLIDADSAGLAEMLTEAQNAVAAALKPHEEAKRGLEAARYQLQRAEDEATEAELVEHAGKLEALLLENIRQLDTARKRLGGGKPVWAPSSTLLSECNRLRLQRGSM